MATIKNSLVILVVLLVIALVVLTILLAPAQAATIYPDSNNFLFPTDSELTYRFSTRSFRYNFLDVLPTQVRFAMYGNPTQEQELSAYSFNITLFSEDGSLFTDSVSSQPTLSSYSTNYSSGALVSVSSLFSNVSQSLFTQTDEMSQTLFFSIHNTGPNFLVDRVTPALSSAFSVSLIANPCGLHSYCSVGASTIGVHNSLTLTTPDEAFTTSFAVADYTPLFRLDENLPTSVPEGSNLVPLGLLTLFGLRRVLGPTK